VDEAMKQRELNEAIQLCNTSNDKSGIADWVRKYQMSEPTKQREWDEAVQLFRMSNDKSGIVEWLRKFQDPYEPPDLCFLADLIDGKFIRKRVGQKENKLSVGIKIVQAGNTVDDLKFKEQLTVEVAVEIAAERAAELATKDGVKLPKLSESTLKKKYFENKKLTNKPPKKPV
jgi:hypothetical protein